MIKSYPVLLALAFIPGSQALGQYCTAVGSTTGQDSNLQSFYLAGESSTVINYTGCPGTIGLNDQTAFYSVTLNAGAAYTAYAGFGTCGGSYAGVGQGWIDFNQNQVFESSETIGTWSGTPPTAPATWNFSVPASAIAGITRMRIVQFEGGTLPIDPCASFTWGSTVDFTVQIGGGMDCSAYVGESLDDPRIVSGLPYSENHSNAVCYTNVQTAYNSPDVFYRVLPGAIGADFMTISLCGSAIDTYLSILDKDGGVLWYNDDYSACGTASQITVATGGIDTLYIAVQGWGYATGNYQLNISQELTSVDSYTLAEARIYPNPAGDRLFIDAPSGSLITVYDPEGRAVLEGTCLTSVPLDISGLSPGLYLVQVSHDSGRFTQKLIVE